MPPKTTVTPRRKKTTTKTTAKTPAKSATKSVQKLASRPPEIKSSHPDDDLTKFSIGTIKIPKAHLWREHPEYQGAISKLKKQVDSSSISAQEEASPYKDDLAERIPRAEIDEHIKFIKRFAPSAIGAGSYRRLAETSNDIDIIIREPIEPLLKSLTAVDYIKHTFAAGSHKFLGVVKHPGMTRFRHLDIIVTNEQHYPFALLYFTGSAQHNIIMRMKAKRLGLKLNEYGLFKDDRPIPNIRSEEDIFAHIGVPYRPPEAR